MQCQSRKDLHELALVTHAQVERRELPIRLHRVKDVEPPEALDAHALVLARETVVDLQQ